jgi:hypothetical protein
MEGAWKCDSRQACTTVGDPVVTAGQDTACIIRVHCPFTVRRESSTAGWSIWRTAVACSEQDVLLSYPQNTPRFPPPSRAQASWTAS